MLYTFSQSQYPESELQRYFAQAQPNDAVVLWGNGVLLPIKHPQLFQQLNAPCYAVEPDLHARGLTSFIPNNSPNIHLISMDKLVEITEKYTPQLGL